MGEHVTDGDGASLRYAALTGPIVFSNHVVRILENPVRDRIIEPEAPLFEQHHERRGHDRLGHRRQGEDRVGGHRDVLLPILRPHRRVMHHLAPSRYQGDRASNLVVVDESLEVVVNSLQPLGRHADRFRGHCRQVFGRSKLPGRHGQRDRHTQTAGHQPPTAPASLHLRHRPDLLGTACALQNPRLRALRFANHRFRDTSRNGRTGQHRRGSSGLTGSTTGGQADEADLVT